MFTWWNTLAPRARAAWLASLAVGLLLAAAAAWWVLRPRQAVLFADLSPQDAAVLAAEMDRQKLPYTVGDNGSSLLVDQSQVHALRLKLMGRDLPLHGAVGFELFNNADFGMTEFAQKINYQRALQGELTRTILSFPEVRAARVHLALPEQGLFRQATSAPKAAVTLTLAPGSGLRAEQVGGIQRLVAAAVPGLVAQDVTLVDQQGVALSRAGRAAEGDAAWAGGQLELKRDTEAYLSRKAGVVLERALGPGQAIATVDVTLDMDQVRTTTEDVLPAAGRGGATGILVRERETVRDNAAPEPRGPESRPVRGSSMQRDAEYQAGRRVEQVVSQPGSIRRLHVVAVVNQALDASRSEQLRQLVAGAVGASPERGDTVAVQAFHAADPAVPASGAPGLPAQVAAGAAIDPSPSPAIVAGLAGVLALGMLAARGLRRRRASADVQGLTESQRHVALGQVRAWLEDGTLEPARGPASSDARRGP